MARVDRAVHEGASGDLFVDDSCIDCDLCRQIAPATFARSERLGRSFVAAQPADAGERRRSLVALVTCPTASIGDVSKPRLDEAIAALPEPVDATGEVLFCGFASERSYGAASYLIRRPGGNVLVDSPRAARPLLRRLEALGGVELMFLTHRDDVADHATFARHFGCARVIHRADARGLDGIERLIDGEAPVPLAGDLLAIPVPGHTRGSTALLFRDRYLFSGDHLWADDEGRGLEAGRGVCWYSWTEQTRSVEKLAGHRFDRVLPGHGRRFHADSPEAMRSALSTLARGMRRGA